MKKILGMIVLTLFGLLFLGAAFYGVAQEYKTPPAHTSHLILFVCVGLLGALCLPFIGVIVWSKVTDGATLARDWAPTFGRRASQGEIAIAAPAPPVAITPTVTEEHDG